MRNLIQQCYCLGGKHPLDDEKFYELIVKSCNKKLDMQDFIDALKDKKTILKLMIFTIVMKTYCVFMSILKVMI